MLVVGLTGGIASGKSTVSRYLAERGAAIIDADQLSRALVVPGSPALQEIAACFGAEILDSSGALDRKKLAQRIFNSALEREMLNSILHPRIKNKTEELIRVYQNEGKVPLIVVDAPLLLETGMQSLVDEVWVVAVPEDIQVERLMERDGISRPEAEARLNSQMPLQEKIRRADRVIDNSGSVEETVKNLDRLWAEVVENSPAR